ncbi:DUF6966 domain-containing protein [Shewanella algae]|uniref:DUF6966 domain-containing protein n=1 Tax=Shewanella algae TaxID=38313 RepID=UPI0031F5BAE7
MGQNKSELLTVLSELIALYEKHGFDHWKSWIKAAKNEIEDNNFNGIERLLSAYGGMGSINDSYFAKKGWWSKRLIDEKQDNEKLSNLLSKAHKLATALKRVFEDDT